jgi:cytochrome c-type protein NapB
MNKLIVTISLLVVASLFNNALAGDKVTDTEIGLSKTSVFDTPAPSAFDYGGTAPGAGNELLPTSYGAAPPQIPHSVVGLTPVTAKSNICAGCHVQPDKAGKEVDKGQPIPVPVSHYDAPAFGKPEAGLSPTASNKLSGSRFVCTQCHRPQATVDPLVQSNFDTAAEQKGAD